LFQPRLSRPVSTGVDPAALALADSVLATALLPVLVFGARGALDVSGLGGDRDTDLPDDVVSFADAGTDRMRLVRGPARACGAAANRPILGGAPVDPHRHTAALVAGFRAAYGALLDDRTRLLAANGPIRRCAGAAIRVVVRPTRDYADLLDESTHPAVLRDGA